MLMKAAGVALLIFMCTWMAFSDEEPGWGWLALKYVGGAVLFMGGGFVLFWAWEGLSHTR